VASYYTLVASLPALEAPFAEERPPCSRYRLDERLKMLEPEDAAELAALEGVMFFDRLAIELSDEAILDEVERVIATIRSPLLREVAQWRMSSRSVMVALRRRAAGGVAPEPGQRWGYGLWVRAVERNWSKRDFGLGGALPWLDSFVGLVERGEAVALERELIDLVWKYLSRKSEGHYFDFEAVALYVLRWDLVRRRTKQDPAEARKRFDELMEASWGAFATQLEL
jgi:hypothetical protein